MPFRLVNLGPSISPILPVRKGILASRPTHPTINIGGSRLSKATIQTLVAALAERYAARTVTVTYSYVSTVLKDAVENRRIARTPCVGIKLPEIVTSRVEPRSTEQAVSYTHLTLPTI